MKQGLRFGMAAGMVALLLLGCGRVKAVSETALSAEAAGDAAGLAGRMRVVRSVEQGGMPSLLSAGYEDQVLVQDRRIAFQKAILVGPPLAGGAALFLAWPETSGERKILSAFFQQEVNDAANRRVVLTERQAVGFDPVTRQWFLPLDKLLAGKLQDETPALLHLVDLDMTLAGGARLELRIELRMAGPLPEPKSSFRSQTLRPINDTQWQVLEQEVSNPTRRPLVLWVKPAGRVILEREAWNDRFADQQGRPPTLQRSREGIIGAYEIQGLQGGEFVEGAPTPLYRVDLPPGSTRILGWLASPAPETPNCSGLWVMTSRVSTWAVHRGGGCRGECAGEHDLYSTVVQEGLRPLGAQATVSLDSLGEVSDPAAFQGRSAWDEYQSLQPERIRRLERAATQVKTAEGFQGGAPPARCQGWTRNL